jgi:U3 small nucleolar RNA-associated protein 14
MDSDKRKRRDGGKEHLIIRERRVKRMADQYMLHQVPYPYTCRQDYERAMAGGIGPEWNVTQSVKDLTRPEICTRAGKIIEPLSQQAKKLSNKKRKNPTAAKF